MLPATYFRRMDAWKGGGCVTAATIRATQDTARGIPMPERRRRMAEYITKEQVLEWFRPYGHTDEDDYDIEVTHWMPLPEPPKED